MTGVRLSLVASFDDLRRNTKVLTEGIESDFYKFVLNQEECRKKWLEAHSETIHMKQKLHQIETENGALHVKLKHARSQIDHEMKRRIRCEQDREMLERQIALVKELLTDKNNGTVLNDRDRERLAFISNYQPSQLEGSPNHKQGLSRIDESASMLSPSDISYDKTDDDIVNVSYLRSGRRWKRPSAPPVEEMKDLTPPGKRHRQSSPGKKKKSSIFGGTTCDVINLDEAHADLTNASPQRRKSGRKSGCKHRRSHSAKTAVIRADDTRDGYWNDHDRGVLREKQNENITPQNDSPRMRRVTSAGSGLNRQHVFVSKTVIKPETCIPCGKRIKFGKLSMKCKDCRATSHPECRDLVPVPCTPLLDTPRTNKSAPGFIADFAPVDPPMIPALVIHCVNEVEARGLTETGIYRISGAEREIKDLKEKFLRGKGTPNLSAIDDIHVVCGCLKDFFRSLKEPLVTFELWPEFVSAAETSDREERLSGTYQAISKLPQSNRDTVAFIILHLQRVSTCPDCKMPASNLAKVFGPTLIGYSTQNPEPMQMINETKKQAMVIETLMSVQSDYWENFINVDVDAICPLPHSMLGPLSTPVSVSRTESDRDREQSRRLFGSSASTTTPRFGSRSKPSSKRPTHFFSSPKLK